MEFAEFARAAADIEAESADTAIIERVSALLSAAGDDLPVLARLVQGRVFPAYEGTTLDVGPKLCYEALARAAGQNVAAEDIEQRVADVGEIGAVAADLDLGEQQGLAAFGSGSQSTVTVPAVAEELTAIATASGDGSRDRKVGLLFGLFNRSSNEEARYLARIVLSEMRIGVGEGTVRDAIASAFDVPVDAVEHALQVTNDFGHVAQRAREERAEGLSELHLTIGRPVKAMLAQAGTVTDTLADWETATIEWKYDGARVQAHFDGETVRLFSRNMAEVTDALPEVVSAVRESLTAPAILDGEVVAIDDDGDPLPFQEVLRRFRRKHDIARVQETVSVRFHAFDCLHADGRDLLAAPLVERRTALEAVLSAESDLRSESWLEDDTGSIEAIADDALAAGHEGIMLKDPESTYSPGKRGKHWRKRKPDVETLDLVVTGAEWGEGRRATYLGTFELSARTEDGYGTVGNVATGITDEQLADLTERLEPHVRHEDGQTVDVEPAVVFEVGYEEIQSSSTYDSGYALRFPRFVEVRSDKAIGEADSLERIERLAAQQR